MIRRSLTDIRNLLTFGLAALVLTACGPEETMTSALDPRGPAAADTATHWWLMFWLGLAVFIVVTLLLLYAIFRASRQRELEEEVAPPIADRTFFAVAGLVIPILILAVVLGDSVRTGQAVIEPPDEPALTVEVIGHMFWWEVRYPDYDVVTANEIHIPVNQPVEFALTSADVIHSFWFPELGGKRDLNPHKENTTWLLAEEEDIYWGQCAEFCGVQHALMGKLLVVQSQEEFDQWIAERQEPAVEPEDEFLQRGMEVYFDAGCAMCHAIDGITEPDPAAGAPGPDLTHFGSRMTIASAIEENNYGNLAAWITDPHELKPGVRMPPTVLDPDDLDALTEFLLSLE